MRNNPFNQIQQRTPDLIPEVLEVFTENICLNSTARKLGEVKYVGLSLECALLQMMTLYEINFKDLRKRYPSLIVHEFNSNRKRMSTIVQKDPHLFRIYAKGGPDFLLPCCTKYMASNGTISQLTPGIRFTFLNQASKFADDSLCTMLFAYNDLHFDQVQENWNNPLEVESDLIAVALVGIADPIRLEASSAVAACHRANVIVRIVTGDSINTAQAIARQCGIFSADDGHVTMEGKDFAQKSKLELLSVLPNLRILANSSPQDRYKLVSLLMECGEVVAVAGGRSNDSSVLKKANVGLSMGQTGTEHAKMNSDIVILDDNFNSIVDSLKWGRCVYDKVNAFLQFQLTFALTIMLIVLLGSIALQKSPFPAVQLLWMLFIMDSFAAFAFTTFSPSDALLNRPPHIGSDKLLSKVLLRNIIGHCIYQVGVSIFIYFGHEVLSIDRNSNNIFSVIFNTFIFCQIFNLINSRVVEQNMSVLDGLFQNVHFIAIFLALIGIQVLLVAFASEKIEIEKLSYIDWLISVGFGVGELVIGFFIRLIKFPDHTIHKLDSIRETRRREMENRYRNMPIDGQWAYDPRILIEDLSSSLNEGYYT
jgi:Ca2+-transporting ATPase